MGNETTILKRGLIDSMIKSATYTRLPAGNAICCELVLQNRHLVHGISSVLDLENYDEQRGKEIAYKNAVSKVYDLVTFQMHEMMASQDIINRNAELQDAHRSTAVLLDPLKDSP